MLLLIRECQYRNSASYRSVRIADTSRRRRWLNINSSGKSAVSIFPSKCIPSSAFLPCGTSKEGTREKDKTLFMDFFLGGEGLFWVLFREDSELLSSVTNLAIVKYAVK